MGEADTRLSAHYQERGGQHFYCGRTIISESLSGKKSAESLRQLTINRSDAMLQAIFDIEVVTPLFLAGADQATAELRPPSFRGGMRYWHRALVGGIFQGDVNKVRQCEAQVFGETEHGSAVSIRVIQPPSPLAGYQPGPPRSGKSYLFWSIDKRCQPSAPCCYSPATRFQLMLSAREKDQQLLEKAIISLWLLTNFGGLGARSRRCAGSLAIRSSTQSFNPEIDLAKLLPDRPQSPDELANTLIMGLQEIKRSYNSEKLSEPRDKSFDILSPATCSIWVLTQKAPWLQLDDALEAVGRRLQQYRQSLSDRQREALGLPLGKRKDRLASPLHLHITALEQGYVCVATFFHKGVNDTYRLIESFAHYFSETGFSPKPISLL